MIEKREAMAPEMVDDLSQQICAEILKLPVVKDAGSIGIYLSFRNEVKAEKLFDSLHSQGKLVCTPVVAGTKDIDFVRLDSLSDVKKGPSGVREPTKRECILEDNLDVLIVPGIAFDSHGFRVGWGRGYYDTFLSKSDKLIKIGAAYDFQIIDKIEAEPHDVRMDFVVTEKRVLKFR
jgi:5-formyltetrahydrofolate cyclo-ligase